MNRVGADDTSYNRYSAKLQGYRVHLHFAIQNDDLRYFTPAVSRKIRENSL